MTTPALTRLDALRETASATKAHPAIEYGTHPELGAAMLSSLGRSAGVPLVYDQGALYRYSSKTGLYEAVPREAQELAVQAFDKREVSSKNGKPQPLLLKQHDVRGAVACGQARAAKPGFFASATPGIAFRDAFVCVTAEGLNVTSHSPTHRATVGVPYDYPRAPSAPLFKKFLARVFKDDDDRELKVQLILEFAGACVIGIATRYQQALVLLGAGANGKSKLVDILWALFPEGARSAIPIQSFGSEYRRAMLAGKRFNAVAELPGSDLLSAEVVKAIIAGDQVDARHIREAPFTLKPIAGHLFATNDPPSVQDHSFGFWRRLVPVTFLQNFAEAKDRDPEIAETIIREELPGVMGLVLNAAVRLQKRGRYEIPPSSAIALAEWKKGADQVALWVDDCAEKSDDQAKASDVFLNFSTWCDRNGHKGMNSKKFKSRLQGLGFEHAHLHEGRFWRLSLRRAS